MNDVLNDALSNLEHDNYERSHKGYENRQADVAMIRAALAAQPAASAEPSDEEIDAIAASMPDGAGGMLKQWGYRQFARALLSRYGRPAGDAELLDALRQIAAWPDGGERYGQEKIKRFAQDVIDAAKAPAPEGESQPAAWVAADTLNSPHPTCISSLAYMSQIDQKRGREYVPLTIIDRYAAPVAAQKADDARDAERWREVERQATKKTAYDRYGNGAYWSVGVFSDDSRQTFGETIDAAIAQQRQGEGGNQ